MSAAVSIAAAAPSNPMQGMQRSGQRMQSAAENVVAPVGALNASGTDTLDTVTTDCAETARGRFPGRALDGKVAGLVHGNAGRGGSERSRALMDVVA